MPLEVGAKTYIGDGVYVRYDGFGLELTAENGISVTNKIYIEPSVYEALIAFVRRGVQSEAHTS